eukprot:1985654-Amphidinium_carterae.1
MEGKLFKIARIGRDALCLLLSHGATKILDRCVELNKRFRYLNLQTIPEIGSNCRLGMELERTQVHELKVPATRTCLTPEMLAMS